MDYYAALKKTAVLIHAAAWVNFEETVLNKISRSQKDNCHMISLVLGTCSSQLSKRQKASRGLLPVPVGVPLQTWMRRDDGRRPRGSTSAPDWRSPLGRVTVWDEKEAGASVLPPYGMPQPDSAAHRVLALGRVCASCLDCVTPWPVAHQAPLSMGFSRQEYWSGQPSPSPGDLPNPGIEPGSPAS